MTSLIERGLLFAACYAFATGVLATMVVAYELLRLPLFGG